MPTLRRYTSNIEELMIVEMYKSHFSVHETAAILELSYAAVVYRYKGFKLAKIEQYDRIDLIPNDKLSLIRQETTQNEQISDS